MNLQSKCSTEGLRIAKDSHRDGIKPIDLVSEKLSYVEEEKVTTEVSTRVHVI